MATLNTAVLFIIFNRTDTATKVFDAIKAARPERLYIAGDGPRKDVHADEINCNEARNIVTKIDWDCEVHTLFRQENLGTKYGIIAALDWFFKHEEEGIILEHDCLPTDFFFQFCSTLLSKYRDDTRVMHIGGTNLQFGKRRGNGSYYFSRISSIWGFATWRRVWKMYDEQMKMFPRFEQEDQMINLFSDRRIATWITNMARSVYEGKIANWDYPLGFSIICNNGLCITPNENLVSNIGFGDGATHTTDASHAHANIPLGKMTEIVHPLFFVPDGEADIYQLSLSVDNIKREDISRYNRDRNKLVRAK
jgi:hypothetical protein